MSVATPFSGRSYPMRDIDNSGFFEGAAEGRLRIQQCEDTGRLQHYPRARSIYTGGAVRWIDVSGRGVIHSYSVVRQNYGSPPFHEHVPYVVALIDLDEGCRVLGNIVDCSPDAVEIGQSVEVSFRLVDEARSMYLPFWTLAEGS